MRRERFWWLPLVAGTVIFFVVMFCLLLLLYLAYFQAGGR